MTPQRVFFSHASEDKAAVLQVARRVGDAYPQVGAWIDQFEIVGGQDLITKIGEGLNASDRFLVFLSNRSIDKPWVRAELHEALTHEINGHKPDFVVPVLLERIEALPTFLSVKRYIPLYELTEPRWLADIKGAIDGQVTSKAIDKQANLIVRKIPDGQRPNVGQLVFTATAWAEQPSFTVCTSVQPVAFDEAWIAGGFRGTKQVQTARGVFTNGEFCTRVALVGQQITPGDAWAIRFRFPKGTSFSEAIVSYSPWDGSGKSSLSHILPFAFENPSPYLLKTDPGVYEDDE